MILEILIAALTLCSIGLIVYHHVAWPLLTRRLSRPCTIPPPLADDALPPITVVMPAYNEAGLIAEKIRNLAALDYPADRLRVVIANDGSTDATLAKACAALAEPDMAQLNVQISDLGPNRGKIAVLNEAIADVEPGAIVALTDVSAMLPPDALRRAAAHYADPAIGAVGGTYRVRKDGLAGESVYWRAQTALKRAENALGAPLGMHGAFWTLRREAWTPLAPDTINDDFVLPMEIFRRGWGLRYDDSIVAIELERSEAVQEQRRRRRIAAGNAQQLARLCWLLHPRHGGVALAFASGKALRVLMPFLIATALLGEFALSASHPVAARLAAFEFAGLAGASLGLMLGQHAPRPLAILRYVAMGYATTMIGVARYMFLRERGPWGRAVQAC